MKIDKGRESGYVLGGGEMLKRTADWMEKFSVGSFLVGVYQSSTSGRGIFALTLGIATYAVSIYLTRRGAK